MNAGPLKERGMFTEDDVRELAGFDTGGHLVTSLYFHPPKIQDRARRRDPVALKDLFRRAEQRWNHGRLSSQRLESLRQDSQRIISFLGDNTDTEHGRSDFALFACSALGYFKALPLRRGFAHWARSPETTVSVGEKFIVRPLLQLMDAYPRECVVVVDREEGGIYLINRGEIEERRSVHDDTPARVKGRSFGGYQEMRFRRHVETEVHRHYQHVRNELLTLFKKYRFERLLIAGHKEAMADFESLLPDDLQRRVVGGFLADPHGDTASQVVEKALRVAREHDHSQKERLVAEVLNNAGPLGRGVVGLDATLNALLKREVQVLLVGDGCCAGGKYCPNCGFLGAVSLSECPSCGSSLAPVEDLVDEAVRRAFLENAQVRFINDSSDFQRAGNIGAILRFRSEFRAS
jgi:peptide chain release factor subunit 1